MNNPSLISQTNRVEYFMMDYNFMMLFAPGLTQIYPDYHVSGPPNRSRVGKSGDHDGR